MFIESRHLLVLLLGTLALGACGGSDDNGDDDDDGTSQTNVTAEDGGGADAASFPRPMDDAGAGPAMAACEGLGEGAACSMSDPQGKTVQGLCAPSPDGVVRCRPDGAGPDGGPPPP